MIGGMSDLTIPDEDPRGGHLPDCFLADPCTAPGPHQPIGDGSCWKCVYPCICDRLRACEQRVENRFHFYTGPEVYAKGYDDALRDVVRAISTKPKQIGGYAEPWIKLQDALAAIDALRSES